MEAEEGGGGVSYLMMIVSGVSLGETGAGRGADLSLATGLVVWGPSRLGRI